MKVGAPLFAFFAKGGHDAACSADFDFAGMSRDRQHLTRPCKERQDGAPTVSEREEKIEMPKAGPPADLVQTTKRVRGSAKFGGVLSSFGGRAFSDGRDVGRQNCLLVFVRMGVAPELRIRAEVVRG